MLDRSDPPIYKPIPQFEIEGFDYVRKTNLKRFLLISLVCLVFICYIVNEYLYEQTSFDHIPETLSKLSGETLQVEISEAREKYIKHVESSNTSKIINSATNSETKYRENTTNEFGNSTIKSKSTYRNIFVELNDIQQTPSNIFFLETRCSTEKGMKDYLNNVGFILNARQCCSIESTAFMNLDRPVYIFHSCPIDDDFFKYSPTFVEKLFSYPNLYLVRLNSSEVFHNSPLQELYESQVLETSLFPTEHTSDLIRLLVLWRFGGTYSDIDVVTIRSFNALGSNWAGAQDPDTIANGVLSFEPDGPGHNMLQRALEHIGLHFDGTQWSTNGPLLITPIILQECQTSTVAQAVRKCNGNFTVWPPSILYPVYYPSWELFFKEDQGRQVVAQVEASAFSVHIWNKMSRDAVARVGSTQAYALLAKKFCPQVYGNCGEVF